MLAPQSLELVLVMEQAECNGDSIRPGRPLALARQPVNVNLISRLPSRFSSAPEIAKSHRKTTRGRRPPGKGKTGQQITACPSSMQLMHASQNGSAKSG